MWYRIAVSAKQVFTPEEPVCWITLQLKEKEKFLKIERRLKQILLSAGWEYPINIFRRTEPLARL
jgi:hypothetical protein